MKKIILTMALFGLTFQFLSAAQMYKKDEIDLQAFQTTADNFNDAYYTVGVTIMPFNDSGTDVWVLQAEKLNPVIYLSSDKIAEMDVPVTPGHYAMENLDIAGGSSDWVKMVQNNEADAQYKGPPLFMDFQSEASTSLDYKNEVYQNGEVFSRYFPIIDVDKFEVSGGAHFETWYRVSSESNWTKCETIQDGPNGAVSTLYEIYGDLNDSYPVQNTWNAKVDLPDFQEEIVVRIRAKYGTEPFANPPAPHTDGGGSTPSAQFELDPADPYGISGYSYYDATPGGADEVSYGSGVAKREAIILNNSLTPVGSYDDGVQTYSVFDFTGFESARDQFVLGLSGFYYAINDTSLVAVQFKGSGAN